MSTILTETWAKSSVPASASAPREIAGSADRSRAQTGTTWVCRYDYILIGSVALTLALWVATGIPLTPLRPWIGQMLRSNALWTVACLVILAGAQVVRHLTRFRRLQRRPVVSILARYLGGATLFRAVRYIVSLAIVLTVYSSIKQAIPLINPARWDAQLISFETWLHGGWNPAWALSQIAWPTWWLRLLDYAYYLWFPLMPLVGALFLAHRDRNRREHYLAAFMLLWVAAVLIALFIPSHGPCYVDPDRFPPPDMVMCRVTQDWLWQNYLSLQEISLLGNGGMVFGCGLVALPSLHVAICCLYAIFLWRERSVWRWPAIAYTMLIFLGSVHSGWHYALDGYAGLLLAALATWCTGRLPSPVRSFGGCPILATARVGDGQPCATAL